MGGYLLDCGACWWVVAVRFVVWLGFVIVYCWITSFDLFGFCLLLLFDLSCWLCCYCLVFFVCLVDSLAGFAICFVSVRDCWFGLVLVVVFGLVFGFLGCLVWIVSLDLLIVIYFWVWLLFIVCILYCFVDFAVFDCWFELCCSFVLILVNSVVYFFIWLLLLIVCLFVLVSRFICLVVLVYLLYVVSLFACWLLISVCCFCFVVISWFVWFMLVGYLLLVSNCSDCLYTNYLIVGFACLGCLVMIYWFGIYFACLCLFTLMLGLFDLLVTWLWCWPLICGFALLFVIVWIVFGCWVYSLVVWWLCLCGGVWCLFGCCCRLFPWLVLLCFVLIIVLLFMLLEFCVIYWLFVY